MKLTITHATPKFSVESLIGLLQSMGCTVDDVERQSELSAQFEKERIISELIKLVYSKGGTVKGVHEVDDEIHVSFILNGQDCIVTSKR